MGNKNAQFNLKRKKRSNSQKDSMKKARDAKRLKIGLDNEQPESLRNESNENPPSDIDADNDLIIEKEDVPELEVRIEGRRIVDFQYIMDQLKTLSDHNKAFGCTLRNLQIIKERCSGLHSDFIMKCNMCNMILDLHTSDKSLNNMNVNHAAVTGAMMVGAGMSNLNELLASVDLPILNQRTYTRCHDDIAKWWKSAAEDSMLNAAKEEAELAIACGDVRDGKPIISVTADCCWSKRSYKTNYSALSGVAAIIGYKTGKVLYMGVKNKYCSVCARAAIKGQPPAAHDCHKNHSGSSTSMEQNVIVEGFKTSIEQRNLIYGTLIADGDASTYKKILEARPYKNLQVEKIECTNHLLRNYNGKVLSLTKDTSIPLSERKLLTLERIKRLRTSITCSVRFRKAQNSVIADKIIDLKKDILNSPSHIFGDHTNCETYYCSDTRKNEVNYVNNIPNLFKKIMHHNNNIAFHSKSLLHKVNNNRAEQFNGVVAKFVGGKRVNFSLKNSYTARCHMSVVSFNSTRPQYIMYKSKFNKSPGRALKKIEMTRLKRQQKNKTIRHCRRRLRLSDTDTSHYGEECQKPDMTTEEYDDAKKVFLENLKEQVSNRVEIERDTILQAESALWLELRRCLLTASIFSKVCKRRDGISSAPLVKTMLYSYSLSSVPSIQHGKLNEKLAIEQLQLQENIKIKKCGLFVDDKLFFLGASPDGLYNDGIVELKCPSSAFETDPEVAVTERKIKFWNTDGTLNKKHDWFYQIQGQLHISKTSVCLFAVWTGKNFRLKVEYIARDENFWKTKMENKLFNFYHKCLLPEIVDSRKARSMPLRNTSF